MKQAIGIIAHIYHLFQQPNGTPAPAATSAAPPAAMSYAVARGGIRGRMKTVLMLARSMGYYADQERVREAANEGTDLGLLRGAHAGEDHNDLVSCHAKSIKARQDAGVDSRRGNPSGKRNPRSVLTPKPSSYKGAHYAVFSPTLISPLLRATAPTRVCPVCGAP